MKKLETLTNIAILVVAVMAGVVLTRDHLWPRPAQPVEMAPGGHVTIPGVSWNTHQQTLVLALQTSCHFCTESAPFYKHLVETTVASPVHLVVVMPQPVAEAQAYLKLNAVEIGDVHQAPLSSLKVLGTPTLMLVDSTGTVEHVWLGKLTPGREGELMKTLELRAPTD